MSVMNKLACVAKVMQSASASWSTITTRTEGRSKHHGDAVALQRMMPVSASRPTAHAVRTSGSGYTTLLLTVALPFLARQNMHPRDKRTPSINIKKRESPTWMSASFE